MQSLSINRCCFPLLPIVLREAVEWVRIGRLLEDIRASNRNAILFRQYSFYGVVTCREEKKENSRDRFLKVEGEAGHGMELS